MMQGFLLGLANGATCLAYCIPVLVSFLLQEGRNVRQNLGIKFLGGRLGEKLLQARALDLSEDKGHPI